MVKKADKTTNTLRAHDTASTLKQCPVGPRRPVAQSRLLCAVSAYTIRAANRPMGTCDVWVESYMLHSSITADSFCASAAPFTTSQRILCCKYEPHPKRGASEVVHDIRTYLLLMTARSSNFKVYLRCEKRLSVL
eukprot:3876009-Amphidinium_carterae.1